MGSEMCIRDRTIGTDFPSGEAMEKQEAAIAGNATGQTADQNKCQTAFAY